jgi:hypothetical protein
MPSLPFVYSNEVWTGIEYQAASHMIMMGLVGEGLDIVRACRARYDGKDPQPVRRVRVGPLVRAGHGVLRAAPGAERRPLRRGRRGAPPGAPLPGDFRCFISTATGYGTVGVADGKPFLNVVSGVDRREGDPLRAGETAGLMPGGGARPHFTRGPSPGRLPLHAL